VQCKRGCGASSVSRYFRACGSIRFRHARFDNRVKDATHFALEGIGCEALKRIGLVGSNLGAGGAGPTSLLAGLSGCLRSGNSVL
jgi:hypothetical protein